MEIIKELFMQFGTGVIVVFWFGFLIIAWAVLNTVGWIFDVEGKTKHVFDKIDEDREFRMRIKQRRLEIEREREREEYDQPKIE